MLTTIVMQLLVYKKWPDLPALVAMIFIVLGSIIAGFESFDSDSHGFAFVWGYNLSQSLFDVITEELNKDKKITPFEINLSFSLLALVITLI